MNDKRDPSARHRRHRWIVAVMLTAGWVYMAVRGLPAPLLVAAGALLAGIGWLNLRTTRFCAECGYAVPVTLQQPTVARFCPRCGSELNRS